MIVFKEEQGNKNLPHVDDTTSDIEQGPELGMIWGPEGRVKRNVLDADHWSNFTFARIWWARKLLKF